MNFQYLAFFRVTRRFVVECGFKLLAVHTIFFLFLFPNLDDYKCKIESNL